MIICSMQLFTATILNDDESVLLVAVIIMLLLFCFKSTWINLQRLPLQCLTNVFCLTSFIITFLYCKIIFCLKNLVQLMSWFSHFFLTQEIEYFGDCLKTIQFALEGEQKFHVHTFITLPCTRTPKCHISNISKIIF